MWQLSVLSGLMVTSFCLGALHYHPEPYDGNDGSRPISFDPVTSPPNMLPKKKGCGHRNYYGIIEYPGYTENQAQFGEFPWTVAIIWTDQNNGKTSNGLCGGSLIHPRAVLTSASCLAGHSAEGLVIRAGVWSFWKNIEEFPYQDRTVRKLRVHPQYEKLVNDFAIIIVSKPFEISPHIDVVCLPYADDEFEDDKVKFIATGWGRNVSGGPYQPILKAVELPVVLRDECEKDLQNNAGVTSPLHPSNICAGGKGGVDMCEGDSGAPLVYQLENYENIPYVQVGIASGNPECSKSGIPGVYLNVATARNWIDETMITNGLNTSTYSY